MRVLVCGSRDFSNSQLLYGTLDDLHKKRFVDCIIEGDARGADRIAGYWAKKNKIDLELYPAAWERYGKSAGYKRNVEMLEKGKPDLVLAFYSDLANKSKGTSMMVGLAKEAGVEVIEI